MFADKDKEYLSMCHSGAVKIITGTSHFVILSEIEGRECVILSEVEGRECVILSEVEGS